MQVEMAFSVHLLQQEVNRIMSHDNNDEAFYSFKQFFFSVLESRINSGCLNILR